MNHRRVIVIVLDGCGIGELPDAANYGDQGASTIPNVARAVGGLTLPNLARLGLGNITAIEGVSPTGHPMAAYGRMAERSPGKDSTTGHWELGGIILERPFPVYPNGFPDNLVSQFEVRAGVKTIGNLTASGTEIIQRLGEEHLRTGALVLYTSADSVWQMAAHERIVPVPKLYEYCHIARDLLQGEHAVGRVIARPFTGTVGSFERTSARKDFSLPPPGTTLLDHLASHGLKVLSIGKIYDLFAGRGISKAIKTADNGEVLAAVLGAVQSDHEHRLIFANCVDFDQLWGHRNDERGFAAALGEFDLHLGMLLPALRPEDWLILTADHGCDPTLKHSTDHTREYVPVLLYSKGMTGGRPIGTRDTFADLTATVCELLALPPIGAGTSFVNSSR